MRRRTKERGDNSLKKRRCESIKRYMKISVTLFLLLFAAIISADEPENRYEDIKFERISIGEGLYQSTISCIYQNERGFMWFGKQHGLNRYDGYTFKMYEYDARDPNSLSHNLVRSICEDLSDYLWMGTLAGGVNKFHRETGIFKVYTAKDDFQGLAVYSSPEKNNGINKVGNFRE